MATERRALIFLILLMIFSSTFGQHNLVLYNMQQVPQSNLLNPGKIPLVKTHIGFPALSGIKVGAGNAGFTFNEFDRANMNDAYDFDYAGLNDYLKPGKNRLAADNEIRILNFGFRIGKGYLHLDVGDALFTSGTYTPQSLNMFHDIQQGAFAGSPTDTTYYQGRPEGGYDQSMHEINGAYYRSYSIGYAHQLNRKLSLGGRFRFLQGNAGLLTRNENLMFNYPGDGDYFQINGYMNVYGAGLKLLDDNDFFSFAFQSGNTGFAFDLGGVYQLNEKIEISASAVNLGRINWKENTDMQVVNSDAHFSAVDVDDHVDRWGAIADSLVCGVSVIEDVRFTTVLPQRFYLGGNYFVKPNTSIGLLMNAVRYNGATDIAVAVSGNTRLGKSLGLSAALGYHRYRPINLGVGLSFDLGIFQLYAITDNLIPMFSWKDATAAQAQLGINFNLGRMSREERLPGDVAQEPIHRDSLVAAEVAEMEAQRDSETQKPNRLVESIRPAAPSEITAYFTLKATARDIGTGDQLKGLRVEIYEPNQNDEKELTYIGSFYNGNIDLQLKRGRDYQILVFRRGFETREVILRPGDVLDQEVVLERNFALQKEEPKEDVAPKEAYIPGTGIPAAVPIPENSPVLEDHSDSEEPPFSFAENTAQANLGTYRLEDATSLRQGPGSKNRVLLRFQPGDQVKVLEKTNQWWWKVEFEGKTGFVKALLLGDY